MAPLVCIPCFLAAAPASTSVSFAVVEDIRASSLVVAVFDSWLAGVSQTELSARNRSEDR